MATVSVHVFVLAHMRKHAGIYAEMPTARIRTFYTNSCIHTRRNGCKKTCMHTYINTLFQDVGTSKLAYLHITFRHIKLRIISIQGNKEGCVYRYIYTLYMYTDVYYESTLPCLRAIPCPRRATDVELLRHAAMRALPRTSRLTPRSG